MNKISVKHTQRIAWMLLGTALLSLTGCTSTQIERVQTDEYPAIVSTEMVVGLETQSFRLLPGDGIEIKFYYAPELNESMHVRPDGMINLNLIPPVLAAGKTPEELEAEVSALFEGKIDNPEINVIVRDLSERSIFVDGEVFKPQAIPTGFQKMTVSRALAESGGVRRGANLDSVILIRQVGKEIHVNRFNLAGDAGYAAGMAELIPGDIIYVPKRTIAKLGEFVDLYLDGLMPDFIRFNATYNLGALDESSRSVIFQGN